MATFSNLCKTYTIVNRCRTLYNSEIVQGLISAKGTLCMDHLKDQTLVYKSKVTVPVNEALKDKEIIAFYFSAHWCPPCQRFTPLLADLYASIKDQELPVEIVFVSHDKSEEAMFDYMNEAHGDWFAVPFGSPAVDKLKNEFNIKGIPTLIVVSKDGKIVSKNGRSDVERKGRNAVKDWMNPNLWGHVSNFFT